MDTPEKIKAWLWLLTYKAVHVGEWLSSRGGEVGCKLCGHALESISHCFVFGIVHRQLTFGVETFESW